MSLRKEKAARLKLAILDETHKLIGKKPFDDLYVEEICARVKISKVTFFKYFPRKEDLLLYHFRLWCLDRTIDLEQYPKSGIQGIYFLADKIVDDAETYPGIMLSLIGYLSDLKRTPKPFPVRAEEKTRLYPEVKNIEAIEIQPLEKILETFVSDAIMKKELNGNTSTREVTNLISSTMYGSLLVGHITQQNPLKIFFRRNVDQVIRGLQAA